MSKSEGGVFIEPWGTRESMFKGRQLIRVSAYCPFCGLLTVFDTVEEELEDVVGMANSDLSEHRRSHPREDIP